MEIVIQALKDRIECFDDYFPCFKEKIAKIIIYRIIEFNKYSKIELLSREVHKFIDFMREMILS